jgi:hypothetical protein
MMNYWLFVGLLVTAILLWMGATGRMFAFAYSGRVDV